MNKKSSPNPKPEKKSRLYWELEKNEDEENLGESPMGNRKPLVHHGRKHKKALDTE